jgi:predicted nucleic acid-binding protein
MYRLVIADTSCLIILQKIGRFDLLKAIFQEITVSKEISEEFGEQLPEWIQVKEVADKEKQQILEMSLDRGEASAITLALGGCGRLPGRGPRRAAAAR